MRDKINYGNGLECKVTNLTASEMESAKIHACVLNSSLIQLAMINFYISPLSATNVLHIKEGRPSRVQDFTKTT